MKPTRLQATAGLRRRALLPFCAAKGVTFAACAGTGGLGSVSKTTQLQQGMSEVQVQQLLGARGRVQMGTQGAIWTYSLHEYFKGWVGAPHGIEIFLESCSNKNSAMRFICVNLRHLRINVLYKSFIYPQISQITQMNTGNRCQL